MRPELHPACAAFPPMSQDELTILADNIRNDGLLEPITMLDGQILDGRNRWDACEIVGITPATVEFTGDNPIAFVMAKNIHRRHLPLAQRAFIAETLATLANGSNQFQKKGVRTRTPSDTRRAAAKGMNVGLTTLAEVRFLKKYAAPHIIEMAQSGQVSIHAAGNAIRDRSRDEQMDIKSVEDINQLDTKRRQSRSSHSVRKEPKAKRKMINPPFRHLPPPMSREESGLPEGVAESAAHMEKYGHVQLHPKAVHDMHDNRRLVTEMVQLIVSLTNDRRPSPEQFYAAIDGMLAWKPRRGEGNGWATDFAATAREQLKLLGGRIGRAVAILTVIERDLGRRRPN